MLEYSELEAMAGEIAYLRYKAHTEPESLKHVYEVIGLECALEICGYDVLSTVFEDTLNGVVVVDIRICDKVPFIVNEVFTHVFSLED